MAHDEPMPDFASHDRNKLESSLDTIKQGFNGEELYPSLTHKAAMVFYLITKNHAFENGNKRMAVCILLFFLLKNHKWLHVDPRKLYDIAVLVASSKAAEKDIVFKTVERFITTNMVDSPDELKHISF